MKCPRCQSPNSEGARFCLECGADLQLSCPQCGRLLPSSAKYCDECGQGLREIRAESLQALSLEDKLVNVQRYLPGGLTEKILSQRGKIEGERKQVTVMFCDTEGFSLLAERLGPERVYSVMDEVVDTLIHEVHDYGGTVNKMTGDGIMALFGAPIALEDAPQRAIRSALSIQREIARYSDRKKAEISIPPLRMRIGIHTGPVVVGSLGNDLRIEFTAVGDTVNLASRMQDLAEPGTVYVTDDTFRLTEGLFRFEALGEREVKGKVTPVKAYIVIAPSTRRTRFDVSAERGLTPFLGRERELELLMDGLERAKGGRGQAFSIMGEAGVGKSRLLYEFRKAVANEDVTFLEGRCLSYSTNVAYHPVIDLLKSTFDVREGDDDDRIRDRTKKVLEEMGVDEESTLPYVLELLSVKESGIDALSLSPEGIRDRTLEALIRIVLKGAEARPLVMAVEDLHWVDRSSEDTLKRLLDAISGAQVLLIFTYRPQFVHTWGTKSYHNQVNLMRLSNRETLAMAAYILGTEQIGGDLEELILEKTEGIPFFVEEFMKSLMDLEMIQWNDSGYYLANNVKDLAIPSTIQDVIMARVDSLPEGAKNVLQVGSAIGREFSCELVKRVTGLTEQELNPHLSVLRDSELVYERGIYPQANYIFRHSLTQEVAYESLLLKRRHEIHERIGKAAEDLYSDRIEEFYEVLAHHYSRSRNLKKAYHYQRLSGDKASRRYSNWEAFRCYRQAVETLNVLPETQDNKRNVIDVLLSMEGPMKLLAYPEDSLEILHEGERLSLELGHQRGLATFYSCMGLCYTFRGEPLRGIEYTERCFGTAERIADLDLMAQTAFDLCSSYAVAGQYREVIRVAPPVLRLLEKTHRENDIFGVAFNFNLYSALCAYYGHAKAWLGEFDEGEALCEKGLRFAQQFDNLYCMGMVESVYGLSYVAKGDGTNAVEHLQNAIRYAEEAQIFPILSIACGALGWGYCLLGDLESAEVYIRHGISYASNAALPMMGAIHHLALGLARLESGDLEGAQGSAAEALRLARANNEKHLEGPASILLGRILGRAGIAHAGAAEDHIRQGIELMETFGMRPWASLGYFSLGELYAGQGQSEKSLENLKRAGADFANMGMDHWLETTRKVLQRV